MYKIFPQVLWFSFHHKLPFLNYNFVKNHRVGFLIPGFEPRHLFWGKDTLTTAPTLLPMGILAKSKVNQRKYFLAGGLAATFDLAAFGLYMIAPVKKSVNHSKTLTSMREVQRSLARTTREYVSFCSWRLDCGKGIRFLLLFICC